MASWFVPANIYYYDVFGAFKDLKVLDWKQTSTIIAVGDIVYIYVSNPIRAVMFKCKVNKVNLPVCEIDDSKYVVKGETYQNYKRYMELECLKTYTASQLSYEKLVEHGLNGAIMSQRRIAPSVLEFIESVNSK